MNLELERSADASSFDPDAAGELAPLTSDMRRQIYELKAAYEEFWQQRKFRKGWAKPLFAFDEAVEELLARAAEAVVRIRSHFDELNGSSTVPRGLSKSASSIATAKLPRFKEGRAREYLCSLEQDPRAAPQQFVREIVHATLSNEDGYLEEGLTGDKLDRYIDKITAYMRQRDEQEARATVQLEEKLKRRWAKAEELLKAFYALDADEKASKSHYQSLQKIIKRVDDVREELMLMQRRREAKREQQEQQSVEAEVPQQPTVSAPEEPVATAESQPAPEGEAAQAEEKEESAQPEQQQQVEAREEQEEPKPEQAAAPATEEAQAAAATTEPAAQEDSAAAAADTGKEVVDEESEQRRRIEQEREKAMLKIKNVADSVTRLSDQIEGFTSEATGLDMEELQKEPESAEKMLSKLQKQCLFYSENLMKDLLSLDAISTGTLPGSEEASEEVRPLRKQQVKEIQGLLQDVDQVNSKLKAMLKKVQEEKQRKEEQRKKFEIDERAKQPQQPQQQPTTTTTATASATAAAEKDQARSEGVDMWRSLKLKPKFEMARTQDSIILQAHIPGMREEDIEIERDDDGQAFTVKGLRVPTPAEEAAMRRQLKSVLARDPWGLYYPQGEQERDLLLRMAAGRYGSFSETFEVSPEMDLLGIAASYAGGVLRIAVPIKPHHQRQQRQGRKKAFYPHQQPPQQFPYQQRRRHGGRPHYGGYPADVGGQGFFNEIGRAHV